MIRAIPTSTFNVPAMESWLSDQARQGRRLVYFSGWPLGIFDKAPPEEVTYRLEAANGQNRPDDEL